MIFFIEFINGKLGESKVTALSKLLAIGIKILCSYFTTFKGSLIVNLDPSAKPLSRLKSPCISCNIIFEIHSPKPVPPKMLDIDLSAYPNGLNNFC